MSNQQTVQKILDEIEYVTVATVSSDGQPWNTPVYFAADGNILYWSSHPDSVHSKNIVSNGKACLTIYNSKASEGDGVGVYIQAVVRQLDDKQEVAGALALLGNRRGRPYKYIEKFVGNGPQRIYKAEPLNIWINDAHQDSDGDFIEDFRVEV